MAVANQENEHIGRQVMLSVIVLAVAVGVSLLVMKLLRQEPAQADNRTAIPAVQVARVVQHRSGMTIEADGVVVPYRDIDLSAQVAGQIVLQADVCRAGNYVEAGTLLYRIDPSDYALVVQQLEKDLAQTTGALAELDEQIQGTESQIEVAKKELALRQRELKRQQNLVGVVTSTDVERAEANELAARNSLITLTNRLRLYHVSRTRLEGARDAAATKLAKAKLDLQRTEIKAPVSGVVVQEHVELDTFVQRGTPLVTIEDTARAEVKCKLEMEDLYWLWDRPGRSTDQSKLPTPAEAYDIPECPVDVVYRIAGRSDLEYIWEGRLERFDGIGLDERTRTVPCRVVVDHPLKRRALAPGGPPALVRGMYVTVRIHTQPSTPLLEIPEEALRAGNVVWRVRKDKLTIERVNFITLLNTKGRKPTATDTGSHTALIWLLDQHRLMPGDQVVTSPLEMVYSGMDVRVMQAAPAPARAKE